MGMINAKKTKKIPVFLMQKQEFLVKSLSFNFSLNDKTYSINMINLRKLKECYLFSSWWYLYEPSIA